jgi:hypothetical protein
MNLDDFKNALYKERQAVDAVATTIKSNVVGIAAIIAAVAIPAVPAIFSGRGAYVLTRTWGDDLSWWLAITVAIAIEGAGLFLSWLATKTYSAWRKKVATEKEVWAMVGAVALYALIIIALISFSDAPAGLKVIMAFVPLLGIAFYIGMGFETDLANRLDEAAAEKRQKKEERAANRKPQNRKITANSPAPSRVPKAEWRKSAVNILRENPDISGAKLAEYLGASERTGQNILNELEQAGQIRRDSGGWQVNGSVGR